MELTREEIENYATIDGERVYTGAVLKYIAKQLLAEMDKPKIWDNAPSDAAIAKVHFYKRDKVYARPDGTPEVYTRELPKSPEREIAEKYVDASKSAYSDELRADVIERAINEYKESVK